MIGDNAKGLRQKEGFTQDSLARKVDIPYITLKKIRQIKIPLDTFQNEGDQGRKRSERIDQSDRK